MEKEDDLNTTAQDFGVNESVIEGGKKELLTEMNGKIAAAPSVLLEELLQDDKTLRDRKTQVRSLGFILLHNNEGPQQSILVSNKESLQHDIRRLKKNIEKNECALQESDENLFQKYLNEMELRKSAKKSIDLDYEDEKIEITEEIFDCSCEITEEIGDEVFVKKQSDEIERLREALKETRLNYKQDRDDLMKQLKCLEITTVNVETDWKCLIREKQLNIEELSRKNIELREKFTEVKAQLKSCEKSKQKIQREFEVLKLKDEKIISSLRREIVSNDAKIKQLKTEVDTSHVDKENVVRDLRNEDIGKVFYEKTLNESDVLLKEYQRQIEDDNILVNNLVVQVNDLNYDKEELCKKIKDLLDRDMKRCSQHNFSEQEEEGILQRMKKSEAKLNNELEIWRDKCLESQRTVERLTIFLGQSTSKTTSRDEHFIDKHERKYSFDLYDMLQEIKVEMSGLEKDFILYNNNVDKLHTSWRNYKCNLRELKGAMVRSNDNQSKLKDVWKISSISRDDYF